MDNNLQKPNDSFIEIKTNEDMEFLLSETCAFHDGCLQQVIISGAYGVDSRGWMKCDGTYGMRILVQSQLVSTVELLFEGVLRFCLDTTPNSDEVIYESRGKIIDGMIHFSFWPFGDTDEVIAQKMSWRFCEPNLNDSDEE